MKPTASVINTNKIVVIEDGCTFETYAYECDGILYSRFSITEDFVNELRKEIIIWGGEVFSKKFIKKASIPSIMQIFADLFSESDFTKLFYLFLNGKSLKGVNNVIVTDTF